MQDCLKLAQKGQSLATNWTNIYDQKSLGGSDEIPTTPWSSKLQALPSIRSLRSNLKACKNSITILYSRSSERKVVKENAFIHLKMS